MKRAGILGGMGPMATVDLMTKIIRLTDAACDQEHIRLLVDSNTEIPDRTAAILGRGEDPLPVLVRSAVALERMGADFLVMPCNTAHYFLPQMRPFLGIPVISIIDVTADEVARRGMSGVGLLGTSGLLGSGMYQRAFEARGIRASVLAPMAQQRLMDAIYHGVKAGDSTYDIADLCGNLEELLEQGAEALVLACTELPLLFAERSLPYPALDPTELLARAIVLEAGAKLVR